MHKKDEEYQNSPINRRMKQQFIEVSLQKKAYWRKKVWTNL